MRSVSWWSWPVEGQVPVVRFHDIATQCPRPVDTVSPARFAFAPCPDRLQRNTRTYEITQPTGAKIRRTSSDPGRALLTGVAGFGLAAPQDDWNKFDVTGLRGLRNTAPYFHNNSAETLEEVVDHYTELFKRAKVIAPPGVVPPLLSTDGVHFDRPFVPDAAARISAKVVVRKRSAVGVDMLGQRRRHSEGLGGNEALPQRR